MKKRLEKIQTLEDKIHALEDKKISLGGRRKSRQNHERKLTTW